MNTTRQINRWLLMVFGMICMLGMGICYTYSDKKGLSSGLTMAMLGMSATVFSPVVSGWLNRLGFCTSFMIVAFVYLCPSQFNGQ